MVIGGAEDKLRHKAVLTRFARFAGGADGHVVVIPTASSLGNEATQIYRDLFTGLGIGRVSGLRPEERAEANDPAVTKVLAEATGIFLTGGNQSRLTQVVGGTKLADALLLAHDRAMAIQMADQRVRAVEAWQADPTRAPLVLVEPAVDPYGTFAFESTVDFIEAGYRATHAAMAAILRTQ